MAEADGSIIIEAEISDKEAQKELISLTKKIDSMNEKIYQKQKEKMPLVEQSKQLGAELDAAKAKLVEMQSGTEFFTAQSIKDQSFYVKELQKDFDGVDAKVQKIDASINRDAESVSRMENRAGELSAQLAGAGDSTNYMAYAVNRAEKYMNKFANRVKKLASRVFVFTMITTALRSTRTWIWNAIKTNDEAVAAIAKLKGALLTLAQPLVNVIIPAFTEFVNVLTKIVSAVSSVVSTIFGTTVEQSAEAAENLYDEQQALNGVGSAAKKAGKSLASFDEINKLSGETAESGGTGTAAESIAPDFTGLIGERLGEITALVAGALLAVGALLTFSGVNVPLGLALMAAGAITLAAVVAENWDYIVQALEGPLGLITAILSGALLVLGIILAFSGTNIPLGLGLIAVGAIGIAASVTANWETIKTILQEKTDVITAILGGALLVLGAVLAFSGASVPLGLGLMIIGAASIASMAVENWDTVQELLQGPIGVITSIVSGALLALGAILTFSGANIPLGIGLMILGAAVLATTVAANWDTISDLMQGPVGIITALISGALLAIGAVLLFSGANIPLGLGLIFAGAVGIASAIAPNWNYIKDKLKEVWESIKNWWETDVSQYFTAAWWKQLGKDMINGLIESIENGLNSALSGVGDFVNGIVGALNKIPGVDIGEVNWGNIKIPRLATGAVIPPNREFMAVLGDQKSGNNIEAPEDLIRQIVREESGGGNAQMLSVLQAILQAIEAGQIMEIEGQRFAKIVHRLNGSESSRVGVKLVNT